MSDHRYTPLRYAHVGEPAISGEHLLPVEWVMVSRWDFDAAGTHYCVEYLDVAGEIAAEDDCFPTEQDAARHAVSVFRLIGTRWHEGAPRRASA